jgi:hypothetical protein
MYRGNIDSPSSRSDVLRGKEFEMKRSILFCTLALMIAGMSACIFNPDTPPPPPPPPSQLTDLTHPEDVMLNMELAYNKRNIIWYNGVLDQNFTFFLSPGDVGGGLPEQWNREEEITTNTNLFDKGYVGTAPPCTSVFLDIRTEDGIAWVDFNPASNPTETWKTCTLNYDFKFEIAPNTYIPNPGSKAAFTVRDAGPYGKHQHHWQLVEFRDLGGAS